MKFLCLFPTLALLLISSLSFGTDYYSVADGEWENASTWSTRENGSGPAGPPNANDNVIIRHSVTHDAGLEYIHYGNVRIEARGIYSVGTGSGISQPYYFAGDLFEVYGSLITSSDFQHQLRPGTGGDGTENGILWVHSTAILNIGDDLILNSSSSTILDNASCGDGWCHDDIYFVGPNASICGNGKFIVPDIIRAWEDVDGSSEHAYESDAWRTQLENQICNGFSLYGNSETCNTDQPRITGQGSFPVELLSFEATSVQQKVELHWITATELNNDFFTIERSADGQLFQPIATIQGAGTSSQQQTYQATDNQPSSDVLFYRLKQTDFDGQFSYSHTVEVHIEPTKSQLTVFPNPSKNQFFSLQGWDVHKSFTLRLIDHTGKILLSRQVPAFSPQPYQLKPACHLPSGLYFLRMSHENEQLTQTIIIH